MVFGICCGLDGRPPSSLTHTQNTHTHTHTQTRTRFVGGLKFKKHVDDLYRTDDYVTIPSKSKSAPGKKGGGFGGGGGGDKGGRW